MLLLFGSTGWYGCRSKRILFYPSTMSAYLTSWHGLRIFLTVQRLHYAAEEFIGVISIDPAHHQHHAMLRFHPGEGCARANGKVTRFRHAREYAACMVQPDQISVKRRNLTGRAHAFDPLGRNNSFTVGQSIIEQQLPDA